MHVRGRLGALGIAAALSRSRLSRAGRSSPSEPPVSVPPTASVGSVAIAYDLAGRGDGGFNDLAYNGVKQAADELGLDLLEVTAKLDDTDDDRAERLRLLAANGYDAIVAVGFTYAVPLQTVAAEFPDVRFATVDDHAP